MSTLAIKVEPLAVEVFVSTDALHVSLADGRELSAPLAWFPRLLKATKEQRKNWRLIGGGHRHPLGRCRRRYIGGEFTLH
jgi:hypothetical protein